MKGLTGALCNYGHPCPPPFGPAELFKIDPVNFVVTFFSRKKKLLARLLEREYEARKPEACETIIRSGANLPKITSLGSVNATSL
jgi:hypothetical protein